MAPRNLINLESVSLAYGTRHVLDGVSIGVADGDRIGVVGRNGGGKSTLLRVLAGTETVDSGRVTHTGGLRVARLGQDDDLDPDATVGYSVVGDAATHEWASDPRIRDVMTHLLPGVSMDARVGPLSGGERRRVALARILVGDADLLLLDEPTNHLDVEGIDWLANHLATAGRSLILVTHDRWLLDTVCRSTWEVVDGTVHAYDGGYSAYVLARAERARIAANEEANRQNLLRKELAWLQRGPRARTSKPKFRVAAANALIENEPPPRDRYELAQMATTRLGKSVLDVEDVTVEIGGRKLLDDVTWRLGPGDRVGLVGVNGSGKTTVLRLLDGSLAPSDGRVAVGRTVVAAHLAQEVSYVDPSRRVLQAVEEVSQEIRLGRGDTMTAGQMLERFGFAGQRQWTPVGDLSGGERRRLQMLRLLMGEPNVLLLDEPTNDLDVETLTVLEDVLDGWPGTLVVVSHDRWFLERVTDGICALLGDGKLVQLPGGVEQYLQLRREAGEQAPAQSARTRTGDTRAARKEIARIERELSKLERREEGLHEQLADHATDHEKVQELDATLRTIRDERAALESKWLELADEVG
ncbi:ATP-binding cassette subfamily F protein uup [Haloactinopolyspora alba]|uniref:ATP-binding cassette subfamily F protein uup n=1 Tax=Haloactinopolyspora alba TaxID=648780 RepID=A0A2P8E5B4_9ACTN|nr:ABC-F family ATP-binding cassette domain-containing protein [Haloactinopolyspora alba]PSL04656.1 ATP-binding cassette subfamily F protein uup [Haloactinopolyspora alba]